MERQREISSAYNRSLIGRQLRVLVDRFSDEEQMWEGRYEGQAPEIDGVVYLTEGGAEPGEFVEAEITEAMGYDLVATLVPSRRALPVLRN
jgi:ribosomal protein S12 methylthiotransferase